MERYITTERLILRSPMPIDADALCRIKNSDFVRRYNLYPPIDEEGAREEIREYDMVVIEGREGGEFIGVIYIKEDYIRYRVNSIELAGWLDEGRARGGIMTEALRGLIPVLFDEGYGRLTARVFGDNIASMRLMESVGFIKEGYLCEAVKNEEGEVFDLALYSLSREEYSKKDGKAG